MYYTQYNWTKETIKQHISENFKGKSYDPISLGSLNGNCKYRHKKKKCAVGLFIPDEKYNKDMEYTGSRTVIANYNLESFMPLEPTGLVALQKIHDSSKPHQTLTDMLKWIDSDVIDSN